jgi:A/G-specific adenine glycosylase
MALQTQQQNFFRAALLDWYDPAQRPLPWKHIADPYLIWLSEIILQQTRVEQGMPYFERFSRHYPRVEDLAAAPEDEVMKLWEGLGYYSRARHLHAAAKVVADEMGGTFPDTYEGLLALPGVGPYTAAAIASFAFNRPRAVVDGNVFRVLSRYGDDPTPIDSTAGKKQFSALAQALLDEDRPGRYNQAIMDLGATVCTPRQPDCAACPLQSNCRALANGTIAERPVKARKLQRRDRHFHYLVLFWDGYSLLRKRTEQDIWRRLYEFVLVEAETATLSWEQLTTATNWPEWLAPEHCRLRRKAGPFRQELTHQRIQGTFWEIDLRQAPRAGEDYVSVEPEKWANFAFPKLMDLYFSDNSLYLF